MDSTFDKIITFICCTVFMLGFGVTPYTVIPVMISVIITCFISYFSIPAVSISCFFAYLALTFIFPTLLFFLPLLLYDLFMESYEYVSLICILPVFFHLYRKNLPILSVFLIAILAIFVCIIKKRTSTLLELEKKYNVFHDDITEKMDALNSRSKDLLERQEYEISNATLNERNRIAREIHDTVGHIISRSLLQIGALIAITQEESVKEGLNSIKDTLSTGMDSIRESIHNLHEDSMNLEDKLREMIDDYSFCTVQFSYEISTDFSMKAKYTVLFLVKEALSNVARHSRATNVRISIAEIPAFYQILIHDNGVGSSRISRSGSSGMGIDSLYERVYALSGNIHISNDNGYKIYITLPKETSQKRDHSL